MALTTRAEILAYAERSCAGALREQVGPLAEGESLAGTDLRWADLSDAKLRGADLTGSKLPVLDGAPDPREHRAAVAAHLRAHPELHSQGDWCDGSADPDCDTPCCVAGWSCHLGGGARGLGIPTAAYLLLWVDGLPMPSFDADATRDDILAALEAG